MDIFTIDLFLNNSWKANLKLDKFIQFEEL